jgi:hypothetical protein
MHILSMPGPLEPTLKMNRQTGRMVSENTGLAIRKDIDGGSQLLQMWLGHDFVERELLECPPK